ncbi:hypothetical protein K457DRAFT_26258 [Linnemannia elongata AG-77]|uniref:Uncharacterized protein n=1 Tax=Linnemannia elongata AG-77 TaxID=1314771 RepID=A0A197JCL3_9FUNG|nr:hypothetical protein K457DRAFT_26258 [Linnemannia elongata AG-77]
MDLLSKVLLYLAEGRSHKNKLLSRDTTPQLSRKKMGVRADLIWRSMLAPEKDWAIGEAARTWDELGQKFIHESTFKLPRQLHDVLMARSLEVGGPDRMRGVLVSGLVIGGKTPIFVNALLIWIYTNN